MYVQATQQDVIISNSSSSTHSASCEDEWVFISRQVAKILRAYLCGVRFHFVLRSKDNFDEILVTNSTVKLLTMATEKYPAVERVGIWIVFMGIPSHLIWGILEIKNEDYIFQFDSRATQQSYLSTHFTTSLLFDSTGRIVGITRRNINSFSKQLHMTPPEERGRFVGSQSFRSIESMKQDGPWKTHNI